LRLASEASVVLRIPHHAGHFIAKGATMIEVFGEPISESSDDFDKRVLDAVWLGGDRAATSDIEFYIDQLVEIAVRALSPGVNDPFTAMQCVDQIGASLRQLTERKLPSANHRDEAGNVRVVANTQTFRGALDAALNLIRQYGSTSPSVMMRILETLAVLAEHSASPAHREALLLHARMAQHASQEHLSERKDIEALNHRMETVIEALEGHEDQPEKLR
jgi:uncharacterized membrane protein